MESLEFRHPELSKILVQVKSTLGPKGMDKILMNGEHPGKAKITVTNDGATILKSVGVDNPAAKVLVDIAMVQDSEVRTTRGGEALDVLDNYCLILTPASP